MVVCVRGAGGVEEQVRHRRSEENVESFIYEWATKCSWKMKQKPDPVRSDAYSVGRQSSAYAHLNVVRACEQEHVYDMCVVSTNI